jgi:predicted nuclease with TOPRIM domain
LLKKASKDGSGLVEKDELYKTQEELDRVIIERDEYEEMLRLLQSWSGYKSRWDEYFKKNKQLENSLNYKERLIRELR